MPTQTDIFCKEFLAVLFLENPRTWRLREVLHITPLNPQSYRARTSFQFRIGRDLIQSPWMKAHADPFNPAPPVPRDEVEIILPIDYLPKYVLLDFSLQDNLGRPLPLITSEQSNLLSRDIVRAAMLFLDSRCPDKAHTAAKFSTKCEQIIGALISTGQSQIPRDLDRLNAFPRNNPPASQFSSGMLRFHAAALTQFTGQPALASAICDACHPLLAEIQRSIGSMPAELKTILGSTDGYHSPLLNPALLIAEYLKNQGVDGPEEVADRLIGFLVQSQEFLRGILELLDDERRFWPVINVLTRMSYYYVAYVRLKVPLDRDFLIKMEQVIPTATERHLRWPQRRGLYQLYPIRIGASGSTHVEVSCEHPIELEQVPEASEVFVETHPFPVDVVFGRTGHSTKYHQHFYTNKTPKQIALALERHGARISQQAMLDMRLGIRYAIERPTKLGYLLVSCVACLAFLFLISLYDPANLTPEQLQRISLLSLLTGLLGAVAALRPQENIVAIRTRSYKVFALTVVFLMIGYFIGGLICPDLITALRCMIKRIPWVGRLIM